MCTKLLGSWELVGCQLLNSELKEIPDPFHNASGIIMYTEEGLMSAQIMKNYPLDNFVDNASNLTERDFKDLFYNYIAYFGTYEVNEKEQSVTHKVLGAQWPQMVGQSFTRSFEFKNNYNTVILSNTEFEAIGRQDPVKRYLTWNRIKI